MEKSRRRGILVARDCVMRKRVKRSWIVCIVAVDVRLVPNGF